MAPFEKSLQTIAAYFSAIVEIDCPVHGATEMRIVVSDGPRDQISLKLPSYIKCMLNTKMPEDVS